MASKSHGFTLIEMLLSISILILLGALSLPVYSSFLARNDGDIALQQIVETLRRAQVYARGMNGTSDWSVEVQSSAVTLFKGTSFGSRDTSYDEVISLPGSITATGLGEVRFMRPSGLPTTTGTVTLTTNIGETKTVTINAEGMVDY